jgi:hypothetical protein
MTNKGNALIAELEQILNLHDFHGIGNRMLEVLMRDGQEDNPDADALSLWEWAPKAAARRFQLDDSLTYPCPYRDREVVAADRNTWKKDRYVQLIILAYFFDATWMKLPVPHDDKLTYYHMFAKEQLLRILETLLSDPARHTKVDVPSLFADIKVVRYAYETARFAHQIHTRAPIIPPIDQETVRRQETALRLQQEIERITQEGWQRGWPQSRIDEEIEFARKQIQMEE